LIENILQFISGPKMFCKKNPRELSEKWIVTTAATGVISEMVSTMAQIPGLRTKYF